MSAIIQETKNAKVRIYYIVGGKLAEVALNGNDNAWKPWRAVPEWDPNDGAKQPTSSTSGGGGGAITTTSPSTPSGSGSATGSDTGTAATAKSASGGGFSSGAKIGVGVGVGLGVVALGVIMAAFFLFRRNNNKNSANLNSPEDGTTVVGSEAPSATTSPIPPYGTLATGYGYGAGAGEWDQKMHPGGGGYTNVQQLDKTERPMELDAPRAVFELPDQAYRHELMADHTAIRLEGPGHHGHPGGQEHVGHRRV